MLDSKTHHLSFLYLIIQGKLKQSPFKTGTVSCGIFVAKINLV